MLQVNCLISWLASPQPFLLNEPFLQQEDILQFGRLILALCCNNLSAANNLTKSVELVMRNYSPDLKTVILFLISKPSPVKVNLFYLQPWHDSNAELVYQSIIRDDREPIIDRNGSFATVRSFVSSYAISPYNDGFAVNPTSWNMILLASWRMAGLSVYYANWVS